MRQALTSLTDDVFGFADKMHIVTLIRSEVRQGKIKEPESRAPVPAHPKTDKVQIFGFSF
jgi:hypothetical protein